MATSSTTVSMSSSSTLIDSKAPRQSAAASPQCVSLPTLLPPALPVPSQNRPQSARDTWKTTAYYRKMGRNVVAMATGEASAEVAEVAAAELPEIIKSIQEAWDKLEDKYAVTSLAFAGVIGLWASTGMISYLQGSEANDDDDLLQSDMENIGRHKFEAVLKLQQEKKGLIEPKRNKVLLPGMFLVESTTRSVTSTKDPIEQQNEDPTCSSVTLKTILTQA